jgi:hypothetical protein
MPPIEVALELEALAPAERHKRQAEWQKKRAHKV